MTNAERDKKCDEFKAKYLEGFPANLTSERGTIAENLRQLHDYVEPDQIPGAQSGAASVWLQEDEKQAILGRFRDPKLDRKCITDDMDIIRFYRDELGEEPPSLVEAGPRRRLHYDPTSARVAILTSGGIAPGLNTVVESIVGRHVRGYDLDLSPPQTGVILGFYDGFVGLEEDRFCELHTERRAGISYNDDRKIVTGWSRFGGSRIGVGRGAKNVHRWLEVLRKRNIDILYVIGGDGSLTAAHTLAEEAMRRKLDLSIAFVPKTMDNDILWVWQSFGFVTAFDKAAEIIDVLHTEAESCRRVCLIQLFGAKSGHVAANASLASGNVDAVLIPEEDFEVDLVCEYVVRTVSGQIREDRKHHAVIVIAEGIRGIEKKDGKWLRWSAETREQRDRNFDRMQKALQTALESAELERCSVFGNRPRHVIRSVPPNSHDQVYCRRLADMAVDNCLAGYTNFMISSWLTEYVLVPLKFSAKGALTKGGYKTFPTGGIFWRTVLSSTGQPSFLSDEAREAMEQGSINDEKD